MKRNIALLLTISLILSLLVFPVSAAEKPEVSLSVVSFEENKQFGTITEKEAAAEYKAGDTLALKISFTNDGTDRRIYGYGFDVVYDKDALETYTFTTDKDKEIGPFVDYLEGVATPNFDNAGNAVVASVLTNGLKCDANVSMPLAHILFKVKSDAESGNIKFSVNSGFNNQVTVDEAGTKITDFDYDALVASTKVTGNPPTLGSVVITPDDGNAEAAYGEEKTYTLKALSTKDKDITDCVSWSVNFNGDHANGIDITGNTLKVTNAQVGTYTVTATPKNDGSCTGSATGTFTVVPQRILNLRLALSGYGRGLNIAGAKITGTGVTVGTPTWYEDGSEEEATGSFKAATAYKVSVGLEPDSNHEFAAGAKATLAGKESEIKDNTATFTLDQTNALDNVDITVPANLTAVYGQKRQEVSVNGFEAKFNNKAVQGRFYWENETQSVGDVGEQKLVIVFEPSTEEMENFAVTKKDVTVTVTAADISKATIADIDKQEYTGSAITPEPEVKLGNVVLTKDVDYELSYENHTEIGENAKVKVTGKGNYTGTCEKNFQITKSISACTIDEITGTFVYSGTAYEPTVTVKDGNTVLTQGENNDYTVSYSSNINAGTATVTVTGKGNYTGSVEKHFTIEPQHLSINTSTISIDGTFTYDGEEKKPNVPTLTVGTKTPVTLTLGTDYTVEYSNNINAGSEAKITFKPKTGSNYTFDEFTINFTIGKADLNLDSDKKNDRVRYGDTTAHAVTDWGLPTDVEFTAEMGKVEDEQKILSNATLLGTQLTFRLKETTTANIGNTVTIPVTFSSQNYNDVTITLTITIVKKDDAGLNVLGTATQLTYGNEIGLDYSITTPGKNGKLTATVTGEGNVTVDIENKKLTATRVGDVKITFNYESDETIGTDSISFKVVPNEITVTADNLTREYGKENPEFTYKLTSGRLAPNDKLNIEAATTASTTSDVGEYPITLTNKMGGNYNVKFVNGTLTITKAPLTIESATVKSKEYDGNKTATVTAVEFSGLKNNETLTSSDYTATGEFKDANAGAEKEVGVTVTLNTTGTAANYELKSNTLDAKGTIEKRTTQVRFTEIKNAVYTGKPYARENYTVNSENAIFKFYKADGNSLGEEISAPTDVGKYYITAIVEETANEKLSAVTEGFEITPKSLADADITVEAIPDQTYTGMEIKPAVTIKYNGMTLTADKDYTVAYENCTNVGVATAKITGKGNYEGTTTKTFNITAKPVTNAQVTFSENEFVYDGTLKYPSKVTVVVDGKTLTDADFGQSFTNCTNAGTATAIITFKGNYSGEITKTYTIKPKPINDLNWSGSTSFYTGNAHEVTANVKESDLAKVLTTSGEVLETVNVTVKGGTQTAIGTYIATAAKLDNPNYKLPETGLSHPFEIKNAIASISVTSPATVSATVDGLTIKLVGTMSEGTTPTLKINGVEMTPVNGKITVSGIEYTVDDSNVVKTPANVALTEDTPAVAPKQDATPETKAAANAISDEATKSEGLAAAAAEAVTNEAASKASGGETITAETKLEIQVESYVPASSATDNKATLTLEITPKVTYTYTDKDNEQKTETKTISNSDIKAPVIISVKLPEGMPTTNLFVKHLLKNGGVEYIQVTVDSNNVATWQQSSFSTAILMADDSTATITLVKDNGDQITMTLNRASVGTALPKDGTKTNWKFEGIDGSYSTITEALFDKLAKKGGGTVTATSVSGSSSDSDSKPSKPGNSSSGPLLPSLGDDELLFRDVSKYDYYYNAVKWALKKGVTSGTGRYTFSPDAACTRAQTVTFLWRAAGCPKATAKTNPFTDVHTSDYFYEAVLWAVENGITNGTSSTTFSPNASVTRAQVATFLWRANGEPAAKDSGFTDVAANAYYARAVAWAYAEGITTGTGFGVFSPEAICTRAQIVTFLFRNAK